MLYHQARRQNHRRKTLLASYSEQFGNIVDRHRAEAALMAAKQDAERSADVARAAMLVAEAGNRAKTEFLANMSHELRTPLNAIVGFSSMMMGGLVDPAQSEKFHEYATDINEAGQRLLIVFNDILQLAKIEAGQLDLREDVIDITKCLNDCHKKFKDIAAKKDIAFSYDSPKDLPTVWGDPRKIKQIVLHLLSNAVKFTAAGGKVGLEAEADLKKGLVITVTDTGQGIAAEDIWKAMAPFSQVDGSLDRPHEGSGLGLPLSKAFIELHDGTLTLESEPGTGTTVSIWLPGERLEVPETGKKKLSEAG